MRPLILALMTLWGGAAAAQEAVATFGPADAPRRIALRSTTDISVFGPVLDAFLENRPDLAVDYEQWASNTLYRRAAAECAAGTAGADLLISSGVQQMVQLVNDNCARTYRSELTAALPAARRWRDQLWGISREPAVIIYNRAGLAPAEVPDSRFDMLDLMRAEPERLDGRVATYDIVNSGLGYLFAFQDSREASTFGAVMESFGRADALTTCCSGAVIEAIAEGQYLMAYNVLGSYVMARKRADPRIDATVGIVAPSDYTLVLSRAAMIPRGAQNAADAAALLDFLLSRAGRAALERASLIVPLETLGASEGVGRPIALTPTLLVAMDRQTRAGFIRRWQETFATKDQ